MTAMTKQDPGAVVVHADDTGPIGQLLTLAIERGVPIETLERLQIMYERAQDRAAASEFASALAAFQAECPPIAKRSTAQIATRTGTGYAYRYAALDEIARTIRPFLHARGFSYTWDSAITEKRLLRCVCTLRHTHGHSVTASFEVSVEHASAMSDQQKHAAALTYARRQSLVQVLGLTTTDPDTDGADADPDPTRITEQQAHDLEVLMQDVGLKPSRFLRWAGLERLADLPASRYDEAMARVRAFGGRAS